MRTFQHQTSAAFSAIHPEPPRPARLLGRAIRSGDLEAIAVIRLVAAQHGVSPVELFQPSRSRAPIAATRQLAMYLMHVVLARGFTEIGDLFGRDRTTVAHACARIEDERDNSQFDDEVTRLEDRIFAIRDTPDVLAALAGGGANDA